MKKWNANLLFFASCAFRSKVFVKVTVQRFGIRDPGSGKNSSRIPGIKKAPDPGSATLARNIKIIF
jgi:hypothetical protein